MSEASLKTRWRRAVSKHGIWSKSLSPHQIPGLPDIVAVDCGASGVIRDLRRTRVHWIEAKVVQKGPRAFDVYRDATGPQIKFIRTMGILGVPAWWLVLGERTWMLVSWDCDEVTREQFRRARAYKSPPTELFEPEVDRKKLLEPTASMVEAMETKIVRAFAERKRR